MKDWVKTYSRAAKQVRMMTGQAAHLLSWLEVEDFVTVAVGQFGAERLIDYITRVDNAKTTYEERGKAERA